MNRYWILILLFLAGCSEERTAVPEDTFEEITLDNGRKCIIWHEGGEWRKGGISCDWGD